MPRTLGGAACALLLVAGLAARAQPRDLALRPLTVDDGLSSAIVSAVARDADGFVWAGTQYGADRFDGVRVRPFGVAEGLPDPWVRGLAVDPATGALWAGTARGLARYDPERERFVPARDGPAADAPVTTLAVAGGALWAGTTRGLLRLGPTVELFRAADGALAGDTVRAVVAAPDGGLIVATSGGLTRLDPATGRARHARGLRPRTLGAVGGALWMSTPDGALRRLDPEALRPVGLGLEVGAVVTTLAASTAWPGRAWVGTSGGGLRVLDARDRAAPALRPVPSDGSTRADVVEVIEVGGVLWAATVQGLLRADVSPPRFTTTALGDEAVVSLHVSRRDPAVVWAGTLNGGLRRLDRRTGRSDRWFTDPTHPLAIPFALHEGPDGALWIGGDGPSVFRFEPSGGALREIPLADGGGYVRDLVPSRSRPGHLWVATSEAGVHLVDLARGERVSGGAAAALAGLGAVWTVRERAGEPGVLTVATDGRGLLRVDLATGRVAPVEAACPLGASVVSLAEGAGGALWAGGFEPWLVRLGADGACDRFTDADGLPRGGAGSLTPDAAGALWVVANDGVARLDPATGTFTPFSAADGLPARPHFHPAHDRTPGGELLIGGANGFAAFRPEAVPIDEAPAPVRVVEVRVDGEAVPLPSGPLVLPHDRNDLAVSVAALDLRQPEKTRYRVRLVGADDGWRPSGPEIRYPLLPPGAYTLRVAASNRDGYWSAPAELAVRIRPPVWRTPWFWALVALAAGGLGWAAHRVRVEQLLRVERTRRRIADDLHDDIGSQIASVALRLDTAAEAPGLSADLRDRLGRLSGQARGVVGDLRDTVWLVDAGHDDLRSVADRMEQVARETLDGGRGAVDRGGVPPTPLGMAARRDLYLLFSEALHNAVRHAGAAHVAVTIGMDGGAFRVEVADDGRGFDPEAAGAGRGLGTMRRRADALGAALTVASAPGRGTRVVCRLPLGRHLV